MTASLKIEGSYSFFFSSKQKPERHYEFLNDVTYPEKAGSGKAFPVEKIRVTGECITGFSVFLTYHIVFNRNNVKMW